MGLVAEEDLPKEGLLQSALSHQTSDKRELRDRVQIHWASLGMKAVCYP